MVPLLCVVCGTESIGHGHERAYVRCRQRARGRTGYHQAVAYEHITVDPGRMGGLPCIRDTRVTVSAVLGQLAAGRSVEDVLQDYPYLTHDDILAAFEYAAAVLQERELPLTRPA